MKNFNKRNIILISIAASLAVFMAGMGATLAILSRNTETRANNFTFGQVNIELDEPHWDEDDNILYPGRTVPKDPVVTNTGINDLYVFLKVQIPKANVRIVDEDGKIQDRSLMELVSYTPDYDNWAIIQDVDSPESEYHSIVYGYKKKISTKEPTTALFDKVTFVNAVEGEPATKMSFDMPIYAYAIQADYLEGVDGDDIVAKLTNAYNLYVNS